MNKESKTLDLVLKGQWYDMEDSGEKPEEYREITHYWMSRLFLPGDYFYLWKPLKKYNIDVKMVEILKKQVYQTAEMHFRNYEYVRLRRGYTNITMTFPIKEIAIGMGNPKWGAPTDREVFIIKFGERLTDMS